jgi:signal transduction histidine kinase
MSNVERLNKQTELKSSLTALLTRPAVEAGEVLRVASELARLDEEQVWFSVDAGLIHRLGTELVARQETALSELIKNAYDADATKVEVIFDRDSPPGGSITIEDDGSGMNRDHFIAGFMRLSTTDKVQNPNSPRYGRQRAGRKGIGRFASQRLGEKLTLITQTEDQERALKVEIDWSMFSPESDLVSIGSRITEIPKQKAKGTTLLIRNLRDPWSDAQIERAYRYVMDLLQPPMKADAELSAASEASRSQYAEDPGFTPRILWQDERGEIAVADENSMFLEHRVAGIEGWVDKEGVAWCRIESPRYEIAETLPIASSTEDANLYKDIAGVRLSASYFIIDKEHVPGLLKNRMQHALAQAGGIRLYRNGFRVRPYGEPSDDWLNLASSSGKRSILIPHSNKNFYGFIAIRDVEGRQFNETSSREGVIENTAFEELRVFGRQVLLQAATRIGAARGKKVRTNDPPRAKPADKTRQIAAELERLTSEAETALDPRKPENPSGGQPAGDVVLMNRGTVQQILVDLRATADSQERQEEEVLKDLGMLRVLASLGLLIGQFTHEVRHDLVALAADVNALKRGNLPDSVRDVAARIGDNVSSLRVFASYFDRTIADNARRDLRPQDLRDVLNRFRQIIESRTLTQNLTLSIDIKGAALLTRPMHPSEWASILFNLFTNAEKAIRKARVPGKVLLRAGREGERVFVELLDNGCGIPEADRDRIFDAFFTTTATPDPEAPEAEHAQGSGLGLKIVRDIVTSVEGTVRVVDAPEGYRTCIRVEVPAIKT